MTSCFGGAPSSRSSLSALGGLTQVPVFGSHSPARCQASGASQTTGAPLLHTPAWHVSSRVHEFPSSHGVPSASTGFEHKPVAGSQTPPEWHDVTAQLTALPP